MPSDPCIYTFLFFRIRSVSVELMKPVIIFLLVEPQQSDNYADVRKGFQRLLSEAFQCVEDEQAVELVRLLLALLPKMQVCVCCMVLLSKLL